MILLSCEVTAAHRLPFPHEAKERIQRTSFLA